jgi:hypothetical protein
LVNAGAGAVRVVCAAPAGWDGVVAVGVERLGAVLAVLAVEPPLFAPTALAADTVFVPPPQPASADAPRSATAVARVAAVVVADLIRIDSPPGLSILASKVISGR